MHAIWTSFLDGQRSLSSNRFIGGAPAYRKSDHRFSILPVAARSLQLARHHRPQLP